MAAWRLPGYARCAAIRWICMKRAADWAACSFRHLPCPFKESDKRLIAWYERQMEKLGVHLHMNTTVSREMLKELAADEIFVATGSSARTLDLPGFDSDRVLTAVDALMNPEKVQGDLVIIGGGLTGIEIAYEYARKGNHVTVLEAMDKYLNVDLAAANRNFLLSAVELYHIDLHVNAKVGAFADGSVTYTDPEGGAQRQSGYRDCQHRLQQREISGG